jgi:hypothetical protein
MVFMARMKRGAKTQAVREYISENPDANPKAFVTGLAAKGIKVKLGLANSVKYSKRSKGRKGRIPAVHAAARKTSGGTVTFDHLIEVKRLADSLGGAEHVRAALDMLEQLR